LKIANFSSGWKEGGFEAEFWRSIGDLNFSTFGFLYFFVIFQFILINSDKKITNFLPKLIKIKFKKIKKYKNTKIEKFKSPITAKKIPPKLHHSNPQKTV
jgi:hypothetical protein